MSFIDNMAYNITILGSVVYNINSYYLGILFLARILFIAFLLRYKLVILP
jgi:hypothetical protein